MKLPEKRFWCNVIEIIKMPVAWVVFVCMVYGLVIQVLGHMKLIELMRGLLCMRV